MSVTLRKPMTREAFLEWEERQELRYEFDGSAPVGMTGGTAAHSAIQLNIYLSAGSRLRGKPCRLHTSDMKIATIHGFRYPDACVACSPMAPGTTVVTAPVVVAEILSPSTAATDIVTKNEEYRDTPSIQRYVILAQDRMFATVFARENGDWIGHILSGDASLAMPAIGIELSLSELYEGIAFGARGDEAATG